MLQVSKDKRVTADIVVETLRKLFRDSSNNLMTPEPSMDKEDGDFQNQEQLQLRLYDDDDPPSAFDRWRVRLEDRLGLGPIDWYPLPAVNRLQNATQAKLTWQVSVAPFLTPLISLREILPLFKYRGPNFSKIPDLDNVYD